jgi:hypothetical protein
MALLVWGALFLREARWRVLIPFGGGLLTSSTDNRRETHIMRFMTMVKSAENSGPPPRALMDAIAKLGEEAARAGVLVETGGLMPTAMGARVRLAGGKLSVIDGPFAEAKEVIGGYAVYDLRSKQEAIEWTSRFMNLHKVHWPGWEGESELRQIFDPSAFAPGGPQR